MKRIALGLALLCLMASLFIPALYAEDDAQVTLTLKQVFDVEASVPPAEDILTCEYRLVPKSTPMSAGKDADGFSFTVTGTADINIGPLTFSENGNYLYEITNVTNPAQGCTYSMQEYFIEVYVQSNRVVGVVIQNGDDEKADDIYYEHLYGTVVVDPPVRKIVKGTPPVDSVFTFKLSAEDASYPMPEGSANGVKTVQIAGEGEAEFGTWEYKQEGTYRYSITEVNTGATGYIYDAEVYTIKDDVTMANGQFFVSRTVTNKAGVRAVTLEFTNEYKHTGGGDSDKDKNQDKDNDKDKDKDGDKETGGGTVTISGKKIWNYGSAPTRERPGRITVLIKEGNKTVKEITVTAEGGWQWTAELPRNDKDGNPIHYTVDEANVPNYTHKVNGTDITNTYMSSSYPGDYPRTGDNIETWVKIAGISGGLLFLIILLKRRSRKQEYANQTA
ncbi:MAG: Cna B-type domain-containing protein [Clostridia bacterium]|nr:Cna B-type domain-containing protein [Clostridia bacterium]